MDIRVSPYTTLTAWWYYCLYEWRKPPSLTVNLTSATGYAACTLAGYPYSFAKRRMLGLRHHGWMERLLALCMPLIKKHCVLMALLYYSSIESGVT